MCKNTNEWSRSRGERKTKGLWELSDRAAKQGNTNLPLSSEPVSVSYGASPGESFALPFASTPHEAVYFLLCTNLFSLPSLFLSHPSPSDVP